MFWIFDFDIDLSFCILIFDICINPGFPTPAGESQE